jgi:hypothetical protein
MERNRKRKIDGKKKSKKLERNKDGMKGRERNGRQQCEKGEESNISAKLRPDVSVH